MPSVRAPGATASPNVQCRGAAPSLGAALSLGAHGVWMGSFWLTTAESNSSPESVENMLADDFWRLGTSLAELCAELPDQRIGFCLDTGHAAVNGIDVASEVHAAGERLISIHAHSNDGRSDLHYPLMQGVVDWGRVVAALAEIGYPHRLVLETAGAGDPDGMLARLSTLWRELPG